MALLIGMVPLCTRGAPPPAPLHLMFAQDFLSFAEPERRAYLVGVLDAKLAHQIGTSLFNVLSTCIAKGGIGALMRTLERRVTPTAGATAATLMPFVVNEAVRLSCPRR
jgi:hypothetical protein